MTQGSPLADPNSRFASAWEDVFRLAVVEVDPMKLWDRVKAAETAILARQESLVNGELNRDERRALEDALATLRVLKREVPQSSSEK